MIIVVYAKYPSLKLQANEACYLSWIKTKNNPNINGIWIHDKEPKVIVLTKKFDRVMFNNTIPAMGLHFRGL
jgi:hypothetical protein